MGVFQGILGHLGAFWGNFGHFGDILGHSGIGAFWGIASRWGPRGGTPPTPQHLLPIPEALSTGHDDVEAKHAV